MHALTNRRCRGPCSGTDALAPRRQLPTTTAVRSGHRGCERPRVQHAPSAVPAVRSATPCLGRRKLQVTQGPRLAGGHQWMVAAAGRTLNGAAAFMACESKGQRVRHNIPVTVPTNPLPLPPFPLIVLFPPPPTSHRRRRADQRRGRTGNGASPPLEAATAGAAEAPGSPIPSSKPRAAKKVKAQQERCLPLTPPQSHGARRRERAGPRPVSKGPGPRREAGVGQGSCLRYVALSATNVGCIGFDGGVIPRGWYSIARPLMHPTVSPRIHSAPWLVM